MTNIKAVSKKAKEALRRLLEGRAPAEAARSLAGMTYEELCELRRAAQDLGYVCGKMNELRR